MKVAAPALPGAAPVQARQFGVINLLKAVAAQLIVLHHLAFYGPMADHARPLMPGLIDWLGDDARIAVQIFLVIGGFLAAKSLSPQGLPGLTHPLAIIWRRYTKLAAPFLVAMLLAVGASALASQWMAHDSISAPATLAQFGAHALLLHSVLDFESLSAGAWYVAIDFQLYALTTLLLWLGGYLLGRRMVWLMPIVITLAVAASLMYFNLDADWDVWALYFMGAYGLGILAWWASEPARPPRAVLLLLLMLALPALVALLFDFRSRIALALATACVLIMFGRYQPANGSNLLWAGINGMGKISYAVFLVHFPVCLVVNAAFTHFVPAQAGLQALGAVLAWGTSLLVGWVFQRGVEMPLVRLLTPRAKIKQRPMARTAMERAMR